MMIAAIYFNNLNEFVQIISRSIINYCINIYLIHFFQILYITLRKKTTKFILLLLLLLSSKSVGSGRLRDSEIILSVRRPQPHTTNQWKEEKVTTERILGQQNRICSALTTLQSHTIKLKVIKIVL